MVQNKRFGERELIARILPSISRLQAHQYMVAPGDDAAVLRPDRQVLSIDGITEGTHFQSSWDSVSRRVVGVPLGQALGWKMMGAALSDLAAMGDVTNRWALTYAGAPKNKFPMLMDVLKGVQQSAVQYECALAGGDTVRAKEISLVAAVGGRLRGKPLTRTMARAGHLIAVTGVLGNSYAGLQYLLGKVRLKPGDARYFVKRFFQVEPMFDEGRILSKTAGVGALLDVSDSLIETIQLLTRQSSVGADVELDQAPFSPRFLARFGEDRKALCSGEDYALVFTLDKKSVPLLRGKLPFSIIGVVTPKSSGVRYYSNGARIQTPSFFLHV